MNRVVLFQGKAQYDVWAHFLGGLAAGFRRLELEPVIVDLFAPDVSALFKAAVSKPCELVLGFNGIGSGMRIGGQSAFDALQIPFVAFLVDHPMGLLDRLIPSARYFLALCVDRTHPGFLERYYRGALAAVFMPHGGSAAAEEGGGAGQVRDIEVLFGGSYYDFEARRKGWQALPPEPRQLMETIAAALLADDRRPVHQVALDVVRADRPEVFEELVKILQPVDQYAIGLRRFRCLEALAEAGIRARVFGNGWEKAPFRSKGRLEFNAAAPFGDMLALMRRSKLVLNLLPNFPQGSHERVFSALLNGAVPLTTASGYLSEALEEGREMVSFPWHNTAALPEKIKELLSNPEPLSAMAEKGRATVEGAHRWEHRAEQILQEVRRFKEHRGLP